MIAAFTPGDQTDANSALALLKAMSDPARTQAMLAEIIEKTEAARVAAAEADAAAQRARTERAEANQRIEAADLAEKRNAQLVTQRSAELKAREEALRAGQDALDEAAKQHQQRETQAYAVSTKWDEWKAGEEKRLDEREQAVATREQAVAEAETRVAQIEREAGEFKNKYQTKLQHARKLFAALAE